MALIENIQFLKKYFPGIWYKLREKADEIDESRIKMATSRTGKPTLEVLSEGNTISLHSKYDPVREAQALIDKIDPDEIARHEHFFFYGLGLGYHVEEFVKRYPDKFITLYEPNIDIFKCFISSRRLDLLNRRFIKSIYVVEKDTDAEAFAADFLNRYIERISFITLPAYERIFHEEFERFKPLFVEHARFSRMSRGTIIAHEKRWAINSMMNFVDNLNNPNIFHCDRDNFTDKPAILVAAGPSLDDELDNLRRVKKEGSAYIFAVSSAIKALAAHDIHPDGVVSMDPHQTNFYTFTELVEKGITDVPLIYGTSLGFECLSYYQGPKLYMTMDRDWVSPYYLKYPDKRPLEIVNDAPSVAVTTLQLLALLGFNPIIFVGQNLGMRNKQSYANGIQFESHQHGEGVTRDHMATARDLAGTFEIEDVYGEQMLTNPTYYAFKKALEHRITSFPGRRYINTTKGGAKIEGTEFVPMDQLFGKELSERVVAEEWYKVDNVLERYDIQYLTKQDAKIYAAWQGLKKNLEKTEEVLDRISDCFKYRRKRQLEGEFIQLDKHFKSISKNPFYRVFISPLNMLETQFFGLKMQTIHVQSDDSEKGRMVAQNFGQYVGECRRDLENVADTLYERIHKKILEIVPA